MVVQCYSLYDIKSEVFHVPSYCPNDAAAMRMYQREIGKPNTILHEYPEDFRIFRVGQFNDQNGEIAKEVTPVFVCELKSLIKGVDSEDDNL